jgi:hypothetical protein
MVPGAPLLLLKIGSLLRGLYTRYSSLRGALAVI